MEQNCLVLHWKVPVVMARQKAGDVGTMLPIGSWVLLDGTSTAGFAANYKATQPVLRSFVVAFATDGVQYAAVCTIIFPTCSLQFNTWKPIHPLHSPLQWMGIARACSWDTQLMMVDSGNMLLFNVNNTL